MRDGFSDGAENLGPSPWPRRFATRRFAKSFAVFRCRDSAERGSASCGRGRGLAASVHCAAAARAVGRFWMGPVGLEGIATWQLRPRQSVSARALLRSLALVAAQALSLGGTKAGKPNPATPARKQRRVPGAPRTLGESRSRGDLKAGRQGATPERTTTKAFSLRSCRNLEAPSSRPSWKAGCSKACSSGISATAKGAAAAPKGPSTLDSVWEGKCQQFVFNEK